MQERYRTKEDFWVDYLITHHTQTIVDTINEYPSGGNLTLRFDDLQRLRPSEAEEILQAPKVWLDSLNRALKIVVREEGYATVVSLDSLLAQIVGVPDSQRVKISDLRATDRGKIYTVEGQVRSRKNREENLVVGAFKCQACGGHTRVLQTGTTVREPFKCESCGAKARIELDVSESVYSNIQEVLLQEQIDHIKPGANPENIVLRLAEGHINAVVPGDRVNITGIYTGEHEKKNRNITTWIDVTELTKQGEDFLLFKPDAAFIRQAKEFAEKDPVSTIIDATAGEIYGKGLEKMAILLSIVGGVRRKLRRGSIRRGDIHILLVGDPGSAKSALMRLFSRIAPRALFATGGGSSKAGLCGGVSKDQFGKSGGFSVEAGVLVLATGGTAFIDELDKMGDEDRGAMHGALEQQVVEISKVGIQATLISQCSLVSAANPKSGKFDLSLPLAEQFDLPPTLLTRFDLILPVIDRKSREDSSALSQHRMKTELGEDEAVVDLGFIKKYVAYAKKLEPRLSRGAIEVCHDYYESIHSAAENVTERQREGLYRLSEAHAKLHLRDVVGVEDAEFAVGLHKQMIRLIGYDPSSGEMDFGNFSGLGHTLNQEGRMKAVLGSVRELSKGKPHALTKEVVERLVALGLSEETVMKTIRFLVDRSKLYHPGGGHTIALL